MNGRGQPPQWVQAQSRASLDPKTRDRSVDQLVWGLLPHNTEDPANALHPIMARAVTVATNPTFACAFRDRRAIVPMSVYYRRRSIGGSGSSVIKSDNYVSAGVTVFQCQSASRISCKRAGKCSRGRHGWFSKRGSYRLRQVARVSFTRVDHGRTMMPAHPSLCLRRDAASPEASGSFAPRSGCAGCAHLRRRSCMCLGWRGKACYTTVHGDV
jgi:hypothetical protein